MQRVRTCCVRAQAVVCCEVLVLPRTWPREPAPSSCVGSVHSSRSRSCLHACKDRVFARLMGIVMASLQPEQSSQAHARAERRQPSRLRACVPQCEACGARAAARACAGWLCCRRAGSRRRPRTGAARPPAPAAAGAPRHQCIQCLLAPAPMHACTQPLTSSVESTSSDVSSARLLISFRISGPCVRRKHVAAAVALAACKWCRPWHCARARPDLLRVYVDRQLGHNLQAAATTIAGPCCRCTAAGAGQSGRRVAAACRLCCGAACKQWP